MTDGPIFAYRTLCHASHLQHDDAQALAAEKLQSLHHAVQDYRPNNGSGSWRDRLGLTRRRDPAPQGLYIFGRVGRGKSMLMDIFHDTVDIEHKRRVHFDEFMLEVHGALHEIRKGGGEQDPLGIVAADIAAETWLLCFDEFQVDNIADAMILGRLFQGLFDAGVVIVATSNTAPTELYKDKLQRDRFEPFIELLCEKLDVLELDGEYDYRRESLRAMQLYHTPLTPEADSALDNAFEQLTAGGHGAPSEITVQGRTVAVPLTSRGVARFSFADLCDNPLGAADYLAIAKKFNTLILSGIPYLKPSRRNEAKRFISLMDSLYEHNVNLVCSAEVAPDEIYPEGDGVDPFQRAVSRLLEMQGDDYLALPHITDDEQDDSVVSAEPDRDGSDNQTDDRALGDEPVR
jgi:cell division protein ZapE